MRVLAVLAREIEVQATRNALDLVAGDIATDAGDVRDDLLAAPSAPLWQLAGHVADPLLQSHRVAIHVQAEDGSRAARGVDHPHQQLDRRRLPGAVRPEVAEDL